VNIGNFNGYAGGSVSTGRVSLAGQAEREVPKEAGAWSSRMGAVRVGC
jgi:hypothetical protein